MTSTSMQVVAIILAIVSFIVLFFIAVKTDILKEAKGDSKYSFHKFQIWIWTLVICPLFCIHWGNTEGQSMINKTSLILLGISAATLLTGNLITEVNLKAKKARELKTQNYNEPSLKVESTNSDGFFIDILTDDLGQMSLGRLQNFIFTIIFIVIYTFFFFSAHGITGARYEYIDWSTDSTPFVLMGISSGTFLVAKATLK